MLLKSVRPEHFGPFSSSRELELEEDVTVLTGPNDAGKSLTLRVIELACSEQAASEDEINRDRLGNYSGPWNGDPGVVCHVSFRVLTPSDRSPPKSSHPHPGDVVCFKITLSSYGREIVSVTRGTESIAIQNYRAPTLPAVVVVREDSPIRNEIDFKKMSVAEDRLIRLGFGSQWSVDHYKSLNPLNRSSLVSQAEERLNERMKALLPTALPLRFRFFEVSGNPDLLGVTLVDEHRGHTPLGSRGTGVRRLLNLMGILLPIESATRPTIVLFDEPETSLHADAQHMMRRLLESLASNPKLQVIYTTHSPAMINTMRPRSIRVLKRERVEDRATTTFLNRPYSGNYSLVRSSLGVTPGDSLLYAPITLVIEGATEILCLPLAMRKLAGAGLLGPVSADELDVIFSQAHILDGEGSSFPKMCRLAKSQNAEVAVFVDGDKRGEAQAVKDEFPDAPVVALDAGMEFEDLVPPEVYIAKAAVEVEAPEESDLAAFREWERAEEEAGRLRQSVVFSKRVERWLSQLTDKPFHKPTVMRKVLEEVDPGLINAEPFTELAAGMKRIADKI